MFNIACVVGLSVICFRGTYVVCCAMLGMILVLLSISPWHEFFIGKVDYVEE